MNADNTSSSTGNQAAVLGSPIAHSLSPVLHNAAYEALQLTDWQYGRHDITAETLEDFFLSINDSWAGVSMTMPLKQKALEFGEVSDERVAFLGVSNTAVFDWQRSNPQHENMPHISLYNTDVDGVKLTFADEFNIGSASDARVCIIGSGSTAMSAMAALIEIGARDFVICAADAEQASAMRTKMSSYQKSQAHIDVQPWGSAVKHIQQSDIIISTVPAHATDGLAQEINNLAANISLTNKHLLDVIYDPRPTQLMQSLSAREAIVRGGEHMLLRQALAQVAYMTHLPVRHVIDTAFAHMKTALFEQL
ncbi:shikimate dehydrogenase family protein [Alloscardovia omnicolens]|uniref:shikimate dehydrogenase family protein n=1 Tax=Alloscardovia omnicolens TaxID=419015 RepID=UPI00254CF758|nr:NAD(P)-binding domain-containing protein [Alloscardovia omnicolens]MDK6643381.1 NAD(P)-binding domain-containing protein [Alloscardovia omnicolens]